MQGAYKTCMQGQLGGTGVGVEGCAVISYHWGGKPGPLRQHASFIMLFSTTAASPRSKNNYFVIELFRYGPCF